MEEQQGLIPHLFRTEYRKLVSVLCKRFGMGQIENAEDIASDTFLAATQTWGYDNIPPNPTAWLYNVATNKARNKLQRNSIFESRVSKELKNDLHSSDQVELDLSPENIIDSQLQMMFAICHPVISIEAQIGLSLRTLCGFGIGEIADAFLTNKETINKRLLRAKEKLRDEKVSIAFPEQNEIGVRLAAVLKTIYLLFSEGYYSVSKNQTVRKELCVEAMRLCTMLVEHESTNTPQVCALLSLMCFHASRFDARMDKNGELVLYDEQDTSLWNTDLIGKGAYYLKCASGGTDLSTYHLQAAIAYWNTRKDDTKEKWENILQLYNRLLTLEYSPMAALNRTYALSKVRGKPEAIAEAEKIRLTNNHLYFALMGHLNTGIDNAKAIDHFYQALSLAKTETDRQTIQKNIDKLNVAPR